VTRVAPEAWLLMVQTSGEISVRALVRTHIDISPGGPIRARRALKGNSLQPLLHQDALCTERWAELRSRYGGPVS